MRRSNFDVIIPHWSWVFLNFLILFKSIMELFLLGGLSVELIHAMNHLPYLSNQGLDRGGDLMACHCLNVLKIFC